MARTSRIEFKGVETGPGVVTSANSTVVPSPLFNEEVDPLLILPSESGDDLAQFQAIADRGGGNYKLRSGAIYYFSGPVQLPFGSLSLTTDGELPAYFRPTGWAPTVGDVDNRNNAFFYVEGKAGTITASLNGAAIMGSRQVRLQNVVGSIQAGTWLRIRETVALSIVYEELILAAGVPDGSGYVPLEWGLQQPHGSGAAVVDIVSPPSLSIENVVFDTGGSRIACAVATRNATGHFFDKIGLKSFSRSGFDIVGCFGVNIGHLDDLGSNNALVVFESTHGLAVGDGTWTFDESAPRSFGEGTIRGKIRGRFGCNSPIIYPGLLGRGVTGLRCAGSFGALYLPLKGRDFIPDTTNDAEWNSTTGGIGVVFDTGPAAINYAEFAKGGTLVSVSAEECYSADTGSGDQGPFAVFFHDWEDLSFGQVDITNTGVPPGTSVNGQNAYNMQGVYLVDSTGVGSSIRTRGVNQALSTQGGIVNLTLGELRINGLAQAGHLINGYAIFLNHSTALGPSNLKIAYVDFESIVAPIGFGASFIGDTGLRIGELNWNGIRRFTNVQIGAYSGLSPVTGKALVLDAAAGAGVRKFLAAGALATSPWVVALQGTNYVVAAPLPGSRNSLEIDMAAPLGSVIVTSAAGNFTVNAGATFLQFCGRVNVASTGAGFTEVGP